MHSITASRTASPASSWKPRLQALWLAPWLLVLALTGIADERIRAYFDRAQVYEGDTVTLTIELDGIQRDVEPDLAPLAESFRVGTTGVARETRIVNGRRSDKTRLQVSLVPKGLGEIEVPPIEIAGGRTPPLTLSVEPVPEGGTAAAGDPLRVELSLGAAKDALVVHQQVPLVVRALSERPVLDYELAMPEIEGAVLTQLGRPQAHIETRDGRQVRVIEWRFTLSPERSGTLRIPPVRIAAELEAQHRRGGRSDPFDRLFDDPMIERMFDLHGRRSPFQRGERHQARTAGQTLEVAPRPDAFSGRHWLPAEALRIEDDWASAPPTLAVGEPATRTLTLTAKGLAGNQIPSIDVPAPPGVRVYPETTESDTRSDGATVIGVSRQEVTVIPSRGGELLLPEIRLAWWDTQAQRERQAVVPAVPVQVAGRVAPADAPGGDPDSQAGTSPDAGAAVETDSGAPADAAAPPDGNGQETGGLWLWLGLFAAVLAAAVAGWLLWQRLRALQRRSPAAQPARAAGSRADAARARDALRAACAADDPAAAAKALLGWAAAVWPEDPPANLAQVAERVPRARQQITALEGRLYAPREVDWTGEPLWRALRDGLMENGGNAAADPQDLPPLYPNRV